MKKLINNLCAVVFMLSVLLSLSIAPLNAQTNFMKHAGNPILPLGAPGEWDDAEASFAHVLFDGSTYHMWYSGAPTQNSYRIGYATSSDGINWTKDTLNNPVLGVGAPGAFDDAEVWLPWVIREETIIGIVYKMWYTGNVSSGGIGYASAYEYPTVFTRHSDNPVLTNGNPGAWDQNWVGNPVVLHSDTLYRMWYSGLSASGRWQTGYATSTDGGVNWNKHPNNPVLTVGVPGEWDAVAAMAGTVLFIDGQYHMWYHGTSGGALSGWEIGHAISSDGINWEKDTLNNPILTGDPGQWDADNVGFPRVIKEDNRYRMWYTGRGNSGIDRLGYAEDIPIGIETFDDVKPAHFYLKQNYPNPFNPATTIEFTLPQSGFVTLKVSNILGQEVAALLEAYKPAGQHTINFDASQLTSGIYYYTLTAGDFKQTRKMVLLR